MIQIIPRFVTWYFVPQFDPDKGREVLKRYYANKESQIPRGVIYIKYQALLWCGKPFFAQHSTRRIIH